MEEIRWLFPADHPQGVVVASDSGSEWMLPFWWHHYVQHNAFPVVFVDMGMSSLAAAWCKRRGTVIPFAFTHFHASSREHIDPNLVNDWEAVFPKNYLWSAREGWFKKPFAMLHAPFKQSIWLDLDCEVYNSLAPIFEYAYADRLALAPEPKNTHLVLRQANKIKEGQMVYNAGVVPYAHGNRYLIDWVNEILLQEKHYIGDQDLLWDLVLQGKILVDPLPAIYNWRLIDGFNGRAVIIHWVGERGKKYIQTALAKMNKP